MAGEKILIVEYDPRTLKETKDILQRAGFIVIEASDGLAALSLYEQSKPDLVLMSPMLPKVHGFDVCQRIKGSRAGKGIPVVIITDVYKGKRYRMDAIHLYKADDYIEKPISDEELVKTLSNLVAKYKKEGAKTAEVPRESLIVASREKTMEIDSSQLPFTIEKKASNSAEEKKKSPPSPEIPIAASKLEIPQPQDPQKAKKISLDLDIEKKLADTLSGMEIGLPKFSQKKPSSPPSEKAPEKIPEIKEKAPVVEEKPKETVRLSSPELEAKDVLTSEQLFEDVIQSVEERLGPKAEEAPLPPAIEKEPVKKKAEPKKEVKAEPAKEKKIEKEKAKAVPVGVVPPVEEVKKAPTKSKPFEEDLEKKLSDTLAGLSKELGLKAPAEKPVKEQKIKESPLPAKVEPPKIVEEPIKKAEEGKEKIVAHALSQELPSLDEEELIEEIRKIKEAEEAEKEIKASNLQKMEQEKIVPKPEEIPPVKEEVPQEGILFGSYYLVEKIATGGMAELFKAKKKGVEGFEKELAIKRILPHLSDNEEFIKMFIDEAKLAAKLTHPNIAQIYELGKIENSFFIAMEFVDGKDMRSILKKTKELNHPVPLPVALSIVAKLCGALDYAHCLKDSQGSLIKIVHRDVSPQNVIVSFGGEVKLVDFGIAKAAVKAHQTQTGALKGKLLYMSPEQAWAKPVDRRSDIFALGVVLWEMIANRSLFYDKGDSEVSIIDKVRSATIPPINDYRAHVPDEVAKILTKALQKDSAARYQHASEMQTDVDTLLHRMNIQISQVTLANYISALFSEDKQQLELVEKRLEFHIEEPKQIPPEKKEKVDEAAKSSHPEPAEELHKTPGKPQIAKSFGKMESFSEGIQEGKKRSYLTYIIPGLIGLVVIVVLLTGVFRNKDKGEQTQTAKQTGQLNLVPPDSGKQTTEKSPAVTDTTEKKPATDQKPAEKEKEKPPVEEQIKKEPLKEEQQKKTEQQEETQPVTEATKKEEPKEKPKEEEVKKETPEKIIPPVEPPAKEEPKIEEPKKESPTTEPTVIAQADTAPKTKETPPPEPQLKEGDLVEISSEVVMPETIQKIMPGYPPVALKTKIEGIVILQVLVSEKGDVLAVKSLRGHELLVEAAKESVLKWKFKPATKKGVKVKVWQTVTIPFKLK